MDHLTYSSIVSWRGECYRRFGSILDLEIIPSAYAQAWKIYKGGLVLDVGAGPAKQLKVVLQLPDARYFSLDNDENAEFDFKAFEEIPRELTFQLIAMNQFLEHLTIQEVRDILVSARKVLAEDGLLLISVPNAAHPVRYHADVFHVTNWPFNDLYGMLRFTGYEVVSLQRTNKNKLTNNPLKRWIIKAVCKEFRIDWCDSIVLVGRKSSTT